METHKFTLPSGVECEVREMMVKHQSILSKGLGSQGGKSYARRMSEILADVLVKVGDVENVTEDFAHKMLKADRDYAIIQARQFSLDFPEEFTFTYKFNSKDGSEAEEEFTLDLTEGFPVQPYGFGTVKSYDEIEEHREVHIALDDNQYKDVTFELADGRYGEREEKVKRSNYDVNTPLRLRNPKVHESEDKTFKLLVDKLTMRQGAKLRDKVLESEGRVDTEMQLTNPLTGENVIINVLVQSAFFYPSQTT